MSNLLLGAHANRLVRRAKMWRAQDRFCEMVEADAQNMQDSQYVLTNFWYEDELSHPPLPSVINVDPRYQGNPLKKMVYRPAWETQECQGDPLTERQS